MQKKLGTTKIKGGKEMKDQQGNHHLPWWNRLKYRLLFFGIIMSLLTIAITGWINIHAMKISLEEKVKGQQLSVVQRAAEEVDRLLFSIEDRVELIIDANKAVNLKENHEKWEQALYGLLKHNSEIENAYVYDEKKQIILSAMRFETKPTKTTLDYQMNSGLSNVYFNEEGMPYISMVVPFDPHKPLMGGLLIEISLKSTLKKLTAMYFGKNGYIYIIDEKERLISHTEFSQVILDQKVITSPELKEMLLNRKSLSIPSEFKSYTGKSVIGSVAPIASTNWSVIIEQPVDQAYASIYLLTKQLFFVMIGVASVIIFLSIIFGIWFTRPIELLERAVAKVSKGDFETKIVYKAKHELGNLSESFNEMTAELRNKSESLEQEKERLDTIVNGSGAGFALIHEDHTVEWMNTRLKDWLADGQEGHYCYTLLGRINSPCEDCPITENQMVGCNNEVVNTIDQYGDQKIYRHRMYPLERVKKGDPKYLVVVEDITEQKKLEEMVVQADKLSALGILASGFAHEVNNPLASISAYAEDLKERFKEEPSEALYLSGEVDNYLDIIRNNVDRCKTITNRLLNYSRKGTHQLEKVSLEQTIEDSLVLLQHAIKKKNIKVMKKSEVQNSAVLAEGLQIQQVLVNIMNNAIDAMDQNGTMVISIKEEVNKLMITVKDDGPGMTKEQIHRAFDPFYTTKPIGIGTGLGLYIAYDIMKKMSGDILIDSKLGNGTEVTLIFSASNDDLEEVGR